VIHEFSLLSVSHVSSKSRLTCIVKRSSTSIYKYGICTYILHIGHFSCVLNCGPCPGVIIKTADAPLSIQTPRSFLCLPDKDSSDLIIRKTKGSQIFGVCTKIRGNLLSIISLYIKCN